MLEWSHSSPAGKFACFWRATSLTASSSVAWFLVQDSINMATYFGDVEERGNSQKVPRANTPRACLPAFFRVQRIRGRIYEQQYLVLIPASDQSVRYFATADRVKESGSRRLPWTGGSCTTVKPWDRS